MKQLLATLARVAVGLVFMASGFQKAIAPAEEFAAIMEAYALLPPSYLLTAATLLPWVQLLAGMFLAFGYATRISAGAVAGMLAAFMLALASTLVRGVPLAHCGCFGDIALTPGQALVFDAFLLTATLWAYRFGSERFSLDRWIQSGT